MMSTFSGLVLGVVTAAVVTVMYGDELNRRIKDLGAIDLPAKLPLPVVVAAAKPGQAGKDTRPEKEGRSAEPAAAISAPGKAVDKHPAALVQAVPAASIPVPVDESAADVVLSLEQRWAQYAVSARALTPQLRVPHRACFTRAAAAHGVPETLLMAVARGESNFDSAARSGKDAVGLMQIQWPGTSHHLGIRREADLYDPCTNIDAGARYIAELGERYSGDLHRVLGAYNYGPGRISVGSMPEGAKWYSQYIYQHLQHVLGRDHVASSELLAGGNTRAGYHVLMTFNRDYRAREFLQFLRAQAPGVELAQRSERLGLHEVVLLYESAEDRNLGLQMLQGTGLVALDTESSAVKSL